MKTFQSILLGCPAGKFRRHVRPENPWTFGLKYLPWRGFPDLFRVKSGIQ